MAKRSRAEINDGRFKRRIVTYTGHWTWIGTFKKSRPNTDGSFYLNPWLKIIDEGTGKERCVSARRWIWELTHGRPPEGYVVANVCGHYDCVLPDQPHNEIVKNGQWNNGRTNKVDKPW